MGDFKMGNNTVLTQSGTAKPTFGSGVPAGTIIGWSKSGPLDGASAIASDGEKTIFGSHAHTFKTTDAILMVQCFANVNIYHDTGVEHQNWNGAMRTSADSYGSNLAGTSQLMQIVRGSGGDSLHGTQITFTYVATPSRSIGDSHTFKIWQTGSSTVASVRTNQGSPAGKVIWISYEIAQ